MVFLIPHPLLRYTHFLFNFLSFQLRRSDPLDRNRAEALNPSIVNEYYDLLHTVLMEYLIMAGKFSIVMKLSFYWITLERRLSQ